MSSGTLPFQQYHRTSHLGDGTFGSVVVVYNNDGEEYAMKLFMEEDDNDSNENDNGNDDEASYVPPQPISIGTLREISCLRLLRGQNAHPNIIEMVDIQPKANTCDDDDDDDDNDSGGERGAGTSNYIGMTIPLGKYGSLANAIQKGMLSSISKQQKVHIAFGILSATHYLHEVCGIVHRDMKCDNILLDYRNDTNMWVPIIIDFSLAKPINDTMWLVGNDHPANGSTKRNFDMEFVQHTGEVCTMIYTAPEVVLPTEKGFYNGKAIDMYSIGVVLLELIQNSMFTAEKYKEVLQQIQSAVLAIPSDLPFPNLIRQLVVTDPQQRLSATNAIHHDVFQKFGIRHTSCTRNSNSDQCHPRQIDIRTALPYENDGGNDDDDDDAENEIEAAKENKPSTTNTTAIKALPTKNKKLMIDKKYERRMNMIDRILSVLDSDHPMTRYAAFDYSKQYEQIDDTIDDYVAVGANKKNTVPSQALIDCCIVAYRFFELQVLDLATMDSNNDDTKKGLLFSHWEYEEYVDNEMTIFMMLDFCLYPRTLAFEY